MQSSGPWAPARASAAASSSSVTNQGGQHVSPSSQVFDDSHFPQLADELTFYADKKAETEQALMEDLIAALRKEEKLLDADAWKYAAPRSR
ncbi:unnamed protein product [Calypogeia fissa]